MEVKLWILMVLRASTSVSSVSLNVLEPFEILLRRAEFSPWAVSFLALLAAK